MATSPTIQHPNERGSSSLLQVLAKTAHQAHIGETDAAMGGPTGCPEFASHADPDNEPPVSIETARLCSLLS